MNENSPIKIASLMHMIIAIIVIWNSLFSLNAVANLFTIDELGYNLSIVILISMLGIFFLYMVYQGLIAESLIAIIVMLSIGSYSIAYFTLGRFPEFVLDPVVIVTGVIPVIVIAMDRRRLPLAIGCALVLAGGFMTARMEGDASYIARFVLMFAGGIVFAVYSGVMIYRALRESDAAYEHRAMNASAMCETVGYAMLSMTMIYGIGLANLYTVNDPTLPKVVMILSALFAMIIAVYSAVNGSISSGTTILTIIAFTVLINYTNKESDLNISPAVCTVLLVPLLFTALRFHRKGDKLLMAISLISIIALALRSMQQFMHDSALVQVINAILVIDAAMLVYVSLSRTLYVETGEKKIPLFDGGSFVNEEEPWNLRFQPRPKDTNNTLAIQTYLMASIGLILLGAFLLDHNYGFGNVNERLFHLTLGIVSVLTVIFSSENLMKGHLTEAVGAIFIGISLLCYSACGLFGFEHMTRQDLMPAICIMICGAIFLLHRDYTMGAAFLCAAVGLIDLVFLSGPAVLVSSGVLLIISGLIIMVRYNMEKMMRKKINPTISPYAGASDNVTLSRLAKTLVLFILGLVMLMFAFKGESDLKFVFMMAALTAISTLVSVYGLMKDNSPGFVMIFGTSLLIFVMHVCHMLGGVSTFSLMVILFMWALLPIIIVYLRRGRNLQAAMCILTFLALLAEASPLPDEIADAIFFVTGLFMCVIAVYNWVVHEGLMNPIYDPKLFGRSINRQR